MNKLDLSYFTKQFQKIGYLEDGQRLFTAKERVIGNYRSVRNGYSFESIKQSLHRGLNGQSTCKGLSTIKKVIKEAENALANLPAGYEKTNGKELLPQLIQMKDALQKEGWTSLEKTVTLGRGHLVLSQKKQGVRQLELSQLKEQKQLLLALVDKKIDAISQNTPMSKEEEKQVIQKMLFQIIDPASSFKSSNETIFSASLVKEELEGLYGRAVVKDILQFYHLSDESFLSSQDIQALVVGTTANLTLADIQTIVQKQAWNQCGNQELLQQMQNVKNHLTDENLYQLLLTMRNIQLPSSSIFPSSFEEIKKMAWGFITALVDESNVPCTLNFEQYAADVERIRAFQRVSSYENCKNQELHPVNFTEYLARDIVYSLHNSAGARYRKGLLVPLFDGSQEKGRQHVCRQVETVVAENGLYCSIATPALKNECKGHVPVEILFRGTFDKVSTLRDISFKERTTWEMMEGPGARSFQKYKRKIMKKVQNTFEQVAKETKLPIEPHAIGHSLGASDAQRFIEELSYRYAKEKEVLPLPILKDIKMTVYNPPGVENHVSKSFLKSVVALEEKINVDLCFVKAHHDPVQLAGATYLGAHDHSRSSKLGKKPKNLVSKVLKFFHPNIEELYGRGMFAHTTPMMDDKTSAVLSRVDN